MKNKIIFACLFFLLVPMHQVFADVPVATQITDLKNLDTDADGLSDFSELNIYNTNINNPDTDGDGYSDGEEIKYNFDPKSSINDKLKKKIVVTLADQSLSYMLGDYIIDTFKISSGKKGWDTLPGEFEILK